MRWTAVRTSSIIQYKCIRLSMAYKPLSIENMSHAEFKTHIVHACYVIIMVRNFLLLDAYIQFYIYHVCMYIAGFCYFIFKFSRHNVIELIHR